MTHSSIKEQLPSSHPHPASGQNLRDWQLALRVFAAPADTNLDGDIFGGWLLAQADIAAVSIAAARAQGRVATVAINAFQFQAPIRIGDLVDLYARIDRTGKTSITIDVSAWARRASKPEAIREVATGKLVFVALDDDGRARPLPVLPESCAEMESQQRHLSLSRN
ncbi:MAG: acyl-CoA thioesterase [Halochromatium sp.]|nr:acyl-CoA thioesterase [Halochromatium sp.]